MTTTGRSDSNPNTDILFDFNAGGSELTNQPGVDSGQNSNEESPFSASSFSIGGGIRLPLTTLKANEAPIGNFRLNLGVAYIQENLRYQPSFSPDPFQLRLNGLLGFINPQFSFNIGNSPLNIIAGARLGFSGLSGGDENNRFVGPRAAGLTTVDNVFSFDLLGEVGLEILLPRNNDIGGSVLISGNAGATHHRLGSQITERTWSFENARFGGGFQLILDLPQPQQNRSTEPLPDTDGDGIPDNADACPTKAEDFDGFEDQDGCPDTDNDEDGVLDVDDGPDEDGDGFGECRNDPEDIDGFEDEDGCPDADNDGDGVLDVDDGEKDATGFGACRNDPEDMDGVADGDGCPEDDYDTDGLLDQVDACPTTPINGQIDDGQPHHDLDGYSINGNSTIGCPEQMDPAHLSLEQEPIVLFDHSSAELTEEGIETFLVPMLNDFLRATDQHLLILAHASRSGNTGLNLRLSQARGDVVRNWFINQARNNEEREQFTESISVIAYGENFPITDEDSIYSNGALNINAEAPDRRVRFISGSSEYVEALKNIYSYDERSESNLAPPEGRAQLSLSNRRLSNGDTITIGDATVQVSSLSIQELNNNNLLSIVETGDGQALPIRNQDFLDNENQLTSWSHEALSQIASKLGITQESLDMDSNQFRLLHSNNQIWGENLGIISQAQQDLNLFNQAILAANDALDSKFLDGEIIRDSQRISFAILNYLTQQLNGIASSDMPLSEKSRLINSIEYLFTAEFIDRQTWETFVEAGKQATISLDQSSVRERILNELSQDNVDDVDSAASPEDTAEPTPEPEAIEPSGSDEVAPEATDPATPETTPEATVPVEPAIEAAVEAAPAEGTTPSESEETAPAGTESPAPSGEGEVTEPAQGAAVAPAETDEEGEVVVDWEIDGGTSSAGSASSSQPQTHSIDFSSRRNQILNLLQISNSQEGFPNPNKFDNFWTTILDDNQLNIEEMRNQYPNWSQRYLSGRKAGLDIYLSTISQADDTRVQAGTGEGNHLYAFYQQNEAPFTLSIAQYLDSADSISQDELNEFYTFWHSAKQEVVDINGGDCFETLKEAIDNAANRFNLTPEIIDFSSEDAAATTVSTALDATAPSASQPQQAREVTRAFNRWQQAINRATSSINQARNAEQAADQLEELLKEAPAVTNWESLTENQRSQIHNSLRDLERAVDSRLKSDADGTHSYAKRRLTDGMQNLLSTLDPEDTLDYTSIKIGVNTYTLLTGGYDNNVNTVFASFIGNLSSSLKQEFGPIVVGENDVQTDNLERYKDYLIQAVSQYANASNQVPGRAHIEAPNNFMAALNIFQNQIIKTSEEDRLPVGNNIFWQGLAVIDAIFVAWETIHSYNSDGSSGEGAEQQKTTFLRTILGAGNTSNQARVGLQNKLRDLISSNLFNGEEEDNLKNKYAAAEFATNNTAEDVLGFENAVERALSAASSSTPEDPNSRGTTRNGGQDSGMVDEEATTESSGGGDAAEVTTSGADLSYPLESTIDGLKNNVSNLRSSVLTAINQRNPEASDADPFRQSFESLNRYSIKQYAESDEIRGKCSSLLGQLSSRAQNAIRRGVASLEAQAEEIIGLADSEETGRGDARNLLRKAAPLFLLAMALDERNGAEPGASYPNLLEYYNNL